MNLTQRQIKLVRIIFENQLLNLKEIGSQMNVSVATLRSDLRHLENAMADYDVRITILPGNDLRLYGQENVNYMLKEFQTMQDLSLEKQAYILLLLHERFIVLQDMADALFVSKSLMEKVMSVMLRKYANEIESVRHHGIRVVSSQIERRNAFAELLMPYVKGVDFRGEMEDFHGNHFPLLDYVDRSDVEAAVEAIQEIRSMPAVRFTDESIAMLFLQMVYIAYCYRNWQHVPKEALIESLIVGIQDVKIYESASMRICRILHIPEGESSFFSYLFLMLRKQTISDTDYYLSEMQDVLKKILDRIQEKITIDFHGDGVLCSGLAVHIYTTVIRRNKLKTSFLEQEGEGIRQEYPIGLEMAVLAAQVIQEEFAYTVSKEEIVYLTLHFQAAIERMTNFGQTLRIIVVCHYGMAAACLIAARLERLQRSIQVVGTESMQTFMDLETTDADLIISTESIKGKENIPPVIYVTPMLPERELKEIRQFAEMHCFNNRLMVYIMQAHIFHMEAAEKKEVLERAVNYLCEQGCVSPLYFASLMEREEMSTTDLENIAVPHGNPDYVIKTQLLIIRLKQPVFWGESAVSYIVLFAVKREDFRTQFALITQFFKRLSRPSLRAGLRTCDTMDEQAFRVHFMHMMGT